MIQVHKVSAPEWKELAKDAHMAVFGELPPSTQGRIDFALLAIEMKTDDVVGYVTCRELDSTTLYWSYFGVLPHQRKTLTSWEAFEEMMKSCQKLGYKHISGLIQNTNYPMLKFALKMNFTIVGLRHIDGATMLEHVREFTDAVG